MKTLIEVIKAKLVGNGITDDKTMIMERTIQLVAKLPNGSKNRIKLTDAFIAELWNSLDHPPMIYIGDEYMYRKADGSYNVSPLPSCRTVWCVALSLLHDQTIVGRWRHCRKQRSKTATEHHATQTRGSRDYIRSLGPAEYRAPRSPSRP